MIQVEPYLQRIMYNGSVGPTLSTLISLQRHHLLAVPFENLDIHNGTPIKLDIPQLYQKVVLNKRGGFCYELNGLFYELLVSLGFKCKRVSARVYSAERGLGPEFDHLAILVKFNDEQYLTDVGFGEFAFNPLKLDESLEQADSRGIWRYELFDDQYSRISKKNEDEWTPEYLFTLEERELAEFEGMCHYHQTSPESHFTNKRMISLATKNGRVTIAGNSLKIKEYSTTTETPIKDEEQYYELLKTHFAVSLMRD